MRIEKPQPDKTYLVTGASGFIGRAVCARLLESGATVHGTSRRSVAFDHTNWQHTEADLANAEDVDRLVASARPDYVLHLASCVTGKREIEWVRATVDGNFLSAVHLMTAMASNPEAKIVLAGSLEEPAADEANPVPASPYAASKWAASGYARMMHALHGIRVAVARIFMVYGPGQDDHNKLVPYVCLSAARGESPQLMSGGRPVDWIYVDDVVDGLIALAHGGPDNGDYVDLGSGDLVTTGDVAMSICEISGTGVAPTLGAVPDRAMEQVRVAGADETASLLNWRAATSLADGLQKTFAWYRDLDASKQSIAGE